MQAKTPRGTVAFLMPHTAARNGPYCVAIWPVSEAKTRRFKNPNGRFCNTLKVKRITESDIAGAFNTKTLKTEIVRHHSDFVLMTCGLLSAFSEHSAGGTGDKLAAAARNPA